VWPKTGGLGVSIDALGERPQAFYWFSSLPENMKLPDLERLA